MIGKTNVAPFSPARPLFKYTGQYSFIDDGKGQWRIKFLTSGTLKVMFKMTIDLFLVGAGGGTRGWIPNDLQYGGGGGGYTNTVRSVTIERGEYPIVVGEGRAAAQGESSSAFGHSASGGYPGGSKYGGNGGSAGGCASYGGSFSFADGASDGGSIYWRGETISGQGTTTREFGESSGTMYSPGGAGRYNHDTSNTGRPTPAPNNGGGATAPSRDGIPTPGFSGIVIIRRHKEAT